MRDRGSLPRKSTPGRRVKRGLVTGMVWTQPRGWGLLLTMVYLIKKFLRSLHHKCRRVGVLGGKRVICEQMLVTWIDE